MLKFKCNHETNLAISHNDELCASFVGLGWGLAISSGKDVGGNDGCVSTGLGCLLLLLPVNDVASGVNVGVRCELKSRLDLDKTSVGENVSTKGGDELRIGTRTSCLDLRKLSMTLKRRYQPMTYNKVSIELFSSAGCHTDNSLSRNLINIVIIDERDSTGSPLVVNGLAHLGRVSAVQWELVPLNDGDLCVL